MAKSTADILDEIPTAPTLHQVQAHFCGHISMHYMYFELKKTFNYFM